MIKATDLRIGNLVLYKPYGNQDGEMKTIQGMLGMKAFFDRHSNESGMFHHLQGIPLTPEILERCGFKIMPIGKYESWGNWHTHLGEHSISFDDRYVLFSYNGCTLWQRIKYIHELQNLFFVLTGEELKLQP